MNPEQLLYSETHEWARIEESNGAKIAVVGITDFAVEQLSDVTYLELKEVGAQLSQGEEFGELESVKSVNSLYSPVTGEVIEVNSSLPDELEKLNSDPFIAGWMIKIRVSDESTLGGLLDHEAYRKQCAEEG